MDFLASFLADSNTLTALIVFLAGIFLIIRGGDWFVECSGSIAEILGVPKFVIGATIISIATTLPEMIVSVSATAKGNLEMATGNAIGSVTANGAMIMGILIMCMPSFVSRREIMPKAMIMLSASLVLILGCIFTQREVLTFAGETGEYCRLSIWSTVALLVLFLIFFCENFLSLKSREIQSEKEIKSPKKETSVSQWVYNLIFFVLGAIGIVFGAQLLVDAGTELAVRMGIPQRVISVVAIAIGTSLPELVTAITAVRKKEGALSVGNILGANIIDLTLILPVCSLTSIISGNGVLAVSYHAVSVDMVVCLGAICLTLIPTVMRGRFSRWQGALVLSGYTAYIVGTFLAS